MRDNGFIKLSRKFFTNDIWKEARTFSSCEAWLYLIQAARFDAEPVTRSIGGREILGKEGNIRHLYVSYQKNGIGVKNELEYSLID